MIQCLLKIGIKVLAHVSFKELRDVIVLATRVNDNLFINFFLNA
jgi:hypothetical protein